MTAPYGVSPNSATPLPSELSLDNKCQEAGICVIQLPATVCCWTEFWYTNGSEIYCCRHSGIAVFAIRCAGCKQRYWCAVCLLGFKRTPCTQMLTWLLLWKVKDPKFVSEVLPILCVFCSLYLFFKRLFAYFTLRSLCIILTSDYCDK